MMQPEELETIRVPDVATASHPPYDDLPSFPVCLSDPAPDEEEDLNAKVFAPPQTPVPPDPLVRVPH